MSKNVNQEHYILFFKVTAIIFVPAIVGAIIGTIIDRIFDIEPYGTLATLGVFYIITWVLIITVFLKPKTRSSKESEPTPH